MHPNVHSSIVQQIAKLWKEHKCPSTGKWIKKKWFNGILCSHQNNEILPFATMWIELEGITLSEKSQSEKDNYHMILLICGI